jgi:hypothetical protein
MQAAQERSASGTASLLRDVFIAAALFIATAAFCLWQNTRVAALFDLSYLLDTSWRIAIGQLPYRDFPFAHAPGTFLLHAAIIKLFGRVYWPHIACAAGESGAATLLTWRILLRVLRPLGGRAWWMATLLAATLVPLGIYSIYPHAIYDGDAIFAVLLALWLFTRVAESWDRDTACVPQPQTARAGARRNAIVGASCVLPLLFKQNIGGAFLAAMVAVVAAALARAMHRESARRQLWFLGGMAGAVAVAALAIHATVGLANYRYWTLTFAAQRRLPGIATILGVYHQSSLLWTVPVALLGFAILRTRRFHSRPWRSRIFALLLLAAPFLWMCIALIFTGDPDDRADQLLSQWPHLLVLAALLTAAQAVRFACGRIAAANALLPILLLAAIHGTFLSQQLWGSTYAIWPLLVLVIALLLMEMREIATPLAAVISATLLLCGGLYAASLERLDYLHLDGPTTHATLPALRGMATPGPFLTEFQDLVRFTDAQIPTSDGIVLIPGEEPFCFATGRTPQFPVLLTDLATDPYTPEQTAAEMRAHNIRWLIVKRDLQLAAPPEYETPALLSTVEQDFALYRSLPGYDVYRRR